MIINSRVFVMSSGYFLWQNFAQISPDAILPPKINKDANFDNTYLRQI